MATNKIDMSLDDIIKLNYAGRGRGGRVGRGRGRGNLRGRGGFVRGNRRGTTAGFRGRVRSRFGFGGRGTGGVVRGGVQKRRGFRQSSFAQSRTGAAWQQAVFQTSFQQRSNVGSGDNAGGIGKLLISNLDFGVNDADIKELFSEFGTTRKAAVHYDRSGRSLGTAEVIYTARRAAVNALKQYNNVPLDGRPMKIQLVGGVQNTQSPSTPNVRPTRGFGGRGRGRGRMRGFGRRGRGGRGASQTLTKDELDAQLDAYNAKMDTV